MSEMMTPTIVVRAKDLIHAAGIVQRAADSEDRVRLTIHDGQVDFSVERRASSEHRIQTLVMLDEAPRGFEETHGVGGPA